MTIVDSSVWVEYLKGVESPQTAWVQRELSLRRLGLTNLILCEVLQGVRGDRMFREVKRELMRYAIFEIAGIEIAVASASNYRFLRSRGITVDKTIDCLIATFCILHGHTLLHRDRDFDPFERHLGLKVLHP